MLNINDKKSFVDERAWILDSKTVKDLENIFRLTSVFKKMFSSSSKQSFNFNLEHFLGETGG
jgi:hypothetical protein